MNKIWKTVRVFISSTFRDMQAERDHLVRFVFPRLREDLLKWQIHFVDVDLRWGVTSEQDALTVCREIIDECRPRFMCILGERYGWVPPGKTRSITAEEVYYGALDRSVRDRGFAYFYFRDDFATAAMVETTPGEFRELQGSDNQEKLRELKQAIVDAGLYPFTYPAQWDNESRRLIGLKVFGDRVYDDLLRSIKADPELGDRFVTDTATEPEEFAEENAAMEAFVQEHGQRFVLGSREAILEQLLAHAAASGSNGYLCLTGAPGSGKSALLAHLSQHSTLNNRASILLIRHFVGASPSSTDVRQTLRRFCRELKANCPDITNDIPDDPEKLRAAFLDFLQRASAQQRVVILLDAINEFESSSHPFRLNWLPEELPTYARIILSALEGPILEELRSRAHKPDEIELKLLTAADGEAIIEQFHKRYRKQFEPEQRAALLAKTDAGTPLYLLAALEELRTLGIYEEFTPRITELPSTTHELFSWIMERLENDDGFRDASGRPVGHELVSRFAAMLGASRYGLSQRELVDLLEPNDPQGNVAALLHLLRSYIMRRGELIDFYHSQFRAAAESVWLKTDAERQVAHTQLADYFQAQHSFVEAFAEQPVSPRSANRRKAEELVFQRISLLRAAQLTTTQFEQACQMLESVLTDMEFIEAKCTAGMYIDLELDYRKGLELLATSTPNPSGLPFYEVLRALSRFVEMRSHILLREPNNVLQEAWNFDRDGHVAGAAEKHLRRPESADYVWIRRIHRPASLEQSPLQRTFRTTEGYLRGLDVSLDGEFAAARYGHRSTFTRRLEGEGTLVEMLHLEEGRVVWKHEATTSAMTFCQEGEAVFFVTGEKGRNHLRIWDPRSGRCLQVLKADAGEITTLAAPQAVGIFVSGHEDGEISFWSVRMGTCLGTVTGHRQRVRSLSFTPEGDILVSMGDDNRMLVWDAQRQVLLSEFECFAGQHEPRSLSISAMALSFDGRVLATGVELSYGGNLIRGVMAKIRLWDLETGRCMRVLDGHEAGISCLALSQDGRTLVSHGFDGTWKVWDTRTGNLLRTKKGGGSAVALTADGGLALSGESFQEMTLWETQSGRVLHTWKSPDDPIEYISITPEGSIGIIRAWQKIVILHASAGEVIYQGEHDQDTCIFRITGDGRKLRCTGTSPVAENDLKDWGLNPDGRMALREGDGFFEIWDIGQSRYAAKQPSGSWNRKELQYRGFRLANNRLLGVTEGADIDDTDSIVWDALRNKPLAHLQGDRAQEAMFSIGAEHTLLVTRDDGGTIRVWQMHPLTCLHILPGHMDIGFDVTGDVETRRVTRIDALADLPLLLDDSGMGAAPDPAELQFGPYSELAVSYRGSGMRVYHVPSCRRWSILLKKNLDKEQCIFSVDGQLAASGGFDVSLGLDDLGPSGPGGRRIVRFWDVKLWDRAAGACLQECTGLEEDIAFLRADTHLKRVLTGYYSGTIQLWRLEGRERQQKQEKEAERWAFSRDGRLLVGGKVGQPRFYDLLRHPGVEIDHVRNWLPTPVDQLGDTPMVAAWSEASSRAILSNWIPDDPDLGVFSLDTGELITRLQGHTEPASSILISPAGDIAFSGGSDRTIRMWDIAKGRCLATIKMKDEYYQLTHAFQDTGARLKPWRVLAHRSFDAFSVLDISTGAKVRDIHRSSVIREDPIGILPDGFNVLATTGNSFWIFDVRTGKEKMFFEGHSDIVTACAFHAGAQIAISSQWTGDKRLWVWDIANGHVLARLGGHVDQIKAVALSFDGRNAVTGSLDKTIRVWNLQELVCTRTLYLDGPIVALSPLLANGMFIASQENSSFLLQLCQGWPQGGKASA